MGETCEWPELGEHCVMLWESKRSTTIRGLVAGTVAVHAASVGNSQGLITHTLSHNNFKNAPTSGCSNGLHCTLQIAPLHKLNQIFTLFSGDTFFQQPPLAQCLQCPLDRIKPTRITTSKSNNSITARSRHRICPYCVMTSTR